MKAFLIALVVLALTGCTQTAQVDAKIQASLPQVCEGAASIHTTFVALSITGVVSDKIIFREAQAWAVVEPLCRDPGTVTTTDIAVAAANAYIIAKALKDAKS